MKQEDYVEAFNKPVMIGDTTYSMVELPGSETKLVVDERSKLLGHIDFRTLAKDHVQRCIQLANLGMEAAGPEYVKLKIEVQRLGNYVTELCVTSVDTVSKFKRQSPTTLTDLQSTYGYLQNGFEDRALETLLSASDLAGEMAETAEMLHNSFNKEVNKVEQVLEKTQETEAEKELTARQREMDRINLEMRIERGIQRETKAKENKEEADFKYLKSESEEREAIKNLSDKKSSGFVEFGYELILSMTGGRSIGQSLESKESQYNARREKRKDDQDIMIEREKQEEQAYQNMTELYVKLKNSRSEVELAKFSTEALHKAIYGLKSLRAAMMQAASLWKKMQEHCKALSDSKLKETVANAMHEHNEQRLETWISTPFKKQVISFNAGWVALDGIYGKYMWGIEETQKEMYKYIEEAKKNVSSLTAKFQKDLQDACNDFECR